MQYQIVETDNLGGDYPDEKFVSLPYLQEDAAKRIAAAINAECCNWDGARRYWKVVSVGYQLQLGFEP
jgi:hypothetical protein